MKKILMALILPLALGACEQLGIPDPRKEAAAAEAEGQAIGGACRHSGRALEDCYALNPGASKAAVFAGWRAMNDYMTENKIEVVPATLPSASMLMPRAKKAEAESAEEDGKHASDGKEADDKHAADKSEKPAKPRSRTLRSAQDH